MVKAELLKGEGDERTTTERRVRKCCEYCGENAVYRYTFLLEHFRSNPLSKAYCHDDCSWCSDKDVYTCASCKPETPEGYDPGWGRYTLSAHNQHMFLEWEIVATQITDGQAGTPKQAATEQEG